MIEIVLASVLWSGDLPGGEPWTGVYEITQHGDCHPHLTLKFKNTPVHTGSEDFSLYGIKFREKTVVLDPQVKLQTKEKAPLDNLRVPESRQESACLVMPSV